MRVVPMLRLLAVSALLSPLLPGAPAQASAPGPDDGIVWSHPTGLLTDADLFLMSSDGTGQRRIIDNDQNDFFPAWSPDGLEVAFESSSSIDVDIWILGVDAPRNLTQDPRHANRYPAWSPDGERIVFSRQSPLTGVGALVVLDVDGTRPVRITDPASVNEQPSWSPDGRSIVFVSDRSGNRDLWSVRPDGTGLRQITRTPDIQEANPDWSPDGSRLAYDVCRSATFPCPGSRPNYEVVTADPDGTDVQVLTRIGGIDANPAWSPDGSRLVFRSDRTGWTHIWTMAADGTDLRQLTTVNFSGGVDPDWRPSTP